MELDVETLYHDGAVLVLLHLSGLSYFLFFNLSFLLYHFPTSPGAIYKAQVVTGYGVGVLLWCLSSLVNQTSWIVYGRMAPPWRKLEMAGTLALIYTAAIPCAVVVYWQQAWLLSAYLFCLSILAVSMTTKNLTQSSDASTGADCFRHDCFWLGLLALVPPVHALSQAWGGPPPLALDLLQLAAWNSFCAFCHILRVPERFRVMGEWKLSLYMMHIVMLLSSVFYAQRVWDVFA